MKLNIPGAGFQPSKKNGSNSALDWRDLDGPGQFFGLAGVQKIGKRDAIACIFVGLPLLSSNIFSHMAGDGTRATRR